MRSEPAIGTEPAAPDEAPIQQKRSSRWIIGTAAAVLVIVIVVLATVLSLKNRDDDDDDVPQVESDRTGLGIEAVIAEGLGETGLQLLEEEQAYQQALDWIVHEDPKQLLPTDASILQRFLLAALFFDYGPFSGTCNPSDGSSTADDEEFCFWQTTTRASPMTKTNAVGRRWLSGHSECEWGGVACSSGNVAALTFEGQALKGPIPSQFQFLTSLEALELERNALRGTIPKEWGQQLSLLFAIKLAFNDVTGPLPTELAMLSNLRNFDVTANSLTGTLPTNYGSMSSLERFMVGANILEGPLPSEYRDLSNLRELDLQRSSWTGTLPKEWFASWSELRNLNIEKTSLSGTFPDSLFGATALRVLDASASNFTGTLSTRIGKLFDLRVLRLGDNRFFGSLPTELGLLDNLRDLQVHFNDFSGSVPVSVCNNGQDLGSGSLDFVLADCLQPSNGMSPAAVECPNGCCTYCCDNRESKVCDHSF